MAIKVDHALVESVCSKDFPDFMQDLERQAVRMLAQIVKNNEQYQSGGYKDQPLRDMRNLSVCFQKMLVEMRKKSLEYQKNRNETIFDEAVDG